MFNVDQSSYRRELLQGLGSKLYHDRSAETSILTSGNILSKERSKGLVPVVRDEEVQSQRDFSV